MPRATRHAPRRPVADCRRYGSAAGSSFMEPGMDRKDFRSLLSKLAGSTTRNSSAPSRLLRRVGKAMGMGLSGHGTAFEALENRAMLEGSFATAVLINIDGT